VAETLNTRVLGYRLADYLIDPQLVHDTVGATVLDALEQVAKDGERAQVQRSLDVGEHFWCLVCEALAEVLRGFSDLTEDVAQQIGDAVAVELARTDRPPTCPAVLASLAGALVHRLVIVVLESSVGFDVQHTRLIFSLAAIMLCPASDKHASLETTCARPILEAALSSAWTTYLRNQLPGVPFAA
jgi:hypothetical protein